MCKERKLRPSANHLAHEYPKEFCNGTAVPAHRRGTACPQGVPRGVSGRDCVSVKNSEKKAAVQIAAKIRKSRLVFLCDRIMNLWGRKLRRLSYIKNLKVFIENFL